MQAYTGLWLIGLWQRSKASEQIKRLCGNPEAVASAYSIESYRIADDLGGEDALSNLRDRAWQRGIRMASDMVPNHMGIDSDWVLHRPEYFLSLGLLPISILLIQWPESLARTQYWNPSGRPLFLPFRCQCRFPQNRLPNGISKVHLSWE